VAVERLKLATADLAVSIPPKKALFLAEIYRVAREEERCRNGEIAATTKIYIANSADISSASDGDSRSSLK
jgi:hypothetical protein